MNEWEAGGGGALRKREWTAPEDGETKTIVVAVFHWSRHFKKQRGQTEGNTNRKTERGQIDRYRMSVRERESERERDRVPRHCGLL